MRPIIGEISYHDMTPEDLRRHMRDAEIMRAQAICELFAAMFRISARAGSRAVSSFKGTLADPQIHTSARAR